MGLLADIYISRDEEAVAYDSNHSLPQSDRLQNTSITPLELSTLWAIMRGTPWEVSLMKEFQCLFQRDGGERLIHRLPAAMIADLLKLAPDQMQAVASQWAATDEMRWPAANARRFLEDLSRLAHHAAESGRSVYLWN